jgi:hypothetical protein
VPTLRHATRFEFSHAGLPQWKTVRIFECKCGEKTWSE